jgi:hypothetical protein
MRGCGGMVDTLALGASAARRGGSSPLIRTRTDLLALKVQETPVEWANQGVGVAWIVPSQTLGKYPTHEYTFTF